MLKFIFRRVLETIPVLWIIITITFFLVRTAPGGPFDSERRVSPEVQRNLNARYHLDRPLIQQYFEYLGNIAHGDLGPSFKYANRSVNELVFGALPISIELGVEGMVIALVLGVSVGVLAAVKRNTLLDYIPMSVAVLGICLPTFVIGPLFVLLFGLKLEWFNPSGWDLAADRVLPALTLGLFYAAYVARLTRGGMLEILTQDYIRTAKAKGASPIRIILKHTLRGGLQPTVSFIGPAVAGIITGSFVVETIFQIPGLGRFFITSIANRDYLLVNGTVIVYAIFVVLFNLLVDIILVWMNPKLSLS